MGPRRLVLRYRRHVEDASISHQQEPDLDGDDSVEAASDAEVAPTTVSPPIDMEPRVRGPGGAFASLDDVCVTDVFENRARVMRSVLGEVARFGEFGVSTPLVLGQSDPRTGEGGGAHLIGQASQGGRGGSVNPLIPKGSASNAENPTSWTAQPAGSAENSVRRKTP